MFLCKIHFKTVFVNQGRVYALSGNAESSSKCSDLDRLFQRIVFTAIGGKGRDKGVCASGCVDGI